MQESKIIRVIYKIILTGLLAVSMEAQQADALKISVGQAPESPQSVKRKLGATVVVEVRDDAGRIVPGARVQLTRPGSDAPILGWTDTEGRAYLEDVIPAGQEGKLPILAEARFNGKLGATTFNNAAALAPAPQISRTFTFNKPNHKMRNTLIIAGVVGAAALAIALALTLPGGTKAVASGSTPTTVGIGGVSVGGPR
jgi:hypothetical protein